MRPDESLRITCVELAIKSGEWKGPGRSLTSAALAIEEYVTGKAAIELAKLAQPALLTDAQQAAVRQIVAEMVGTMLEGTDERIRSAISTTAVKVLGAVSVEAANRKAMDLPIGGPA